MAAFGNKKFYITQSGLQTRMVEPVILGIGAVIGLFVLLRLLMGGNSNNDKSKKEAESAALGSMRKVKDIEQRIERIHQAMRTSPDRQREMMAKREEMLLKQKEILKHKTEKYVKKS